MAGSEGIVHAGQDDTLAVTVALAPDADQHVHIRLRCAPGSIAPRHDKQAEASSPADGTDSQREAHTQPTRRSASGLLGGTRRDGDKHCPADTADQRSTSAPGVGENEIRKVDQRRSGSQPSDRAQDAASPARRGSGSNTSNSCCNGSSVSGGSTCCQSAEGSSSPVSSCGDSHTTWTSTRGALLRPYRRRHLVTQHLPNALACCDQCCALRQQAAHMRGQMHCQASSLPRCLTGLTKYLRRPVLTIADAGQGTLSSMTAQEPAELRTSSRGTDSTRSSCATVSRQPRSRCAAGAELAPVRSGHSGIQATFVTSVF